MIEATIPSILPVLSRLIGMMGHRSPATSRRHTWQPVANGGLPSFDRGTLAIHTPRAGRHRVVQDSRTAKENERCLKHALELAR
jgi:hypothetical protein